MTIIENELKKVVEAALFAADAPLTVDQIMALFVEEGGRPTLDEIRQCLSTLQQDYAERGVSLQEVSSGFRFQAKQEYATWVARLWEERPPRYSRALLETLALIVYRQPITRGEIEAVRGVAVSSTIIKTLQERNWVKVVGHKDLPGKPALYATTRDFLDYFNLKSLDELPSLSELMEFETTGAEAGSEGGDDSGTAAVGDIQVEDATGGQTAQENAAGDAPAAEDIEQAAAEADSEFGDAEAAADALKPDRGEADLHIQHDDAEAMAADAVQSSDAAAMINDDSFDEVHEVVMMATTENDEQAITNQATGGAATTVEDDDAINEAHEALVMASGESNDHVIASDQHAPDTAVVDMESSEHAEFVVPVAYDTNIEELSVTSDSDDVNEAEIYQVLAATDEDIDHMLDDGRVEHTIPRDLEFDTGDAANNDVLDDDNQESSSMRSVPAMHTQSRQDHHD